MGSRLFGYVFIMLTIVAVSAGIAGYARNSPFQGDWESTLMIDPGFIGIFVSRITAVFQILSHNFTAQFFQFLRFFKYLLKT